MKQYFSVDIEASGKTPGKYSMLSLGACLVGETSVQFYRELKPISDGYNHDAMKIGCLGLHCLEEFLHLEEYNPRRHGFQPPKALQVLEQNGEEPEQVMAAFADWTNTVAGDATPVLVAAPIAFDGMFITWYFDNYFIGDNPFGYGGEDINSVYRGMMCDMNAHRKWLGMPDERACPHNALDDAVQQAKEFERILAMMAVP
ncbi:3'-5' exoribonuclease [Candidatus Woesearchaeota archaeon]|nr:3'-5' exoribonuclease [Candidatus Woesearchaeota archaeon]